MYESITSYLDAFAGDSLSEEELQASISSFAGAVMQSEWMVPDAIEAMGERAWASKAVLKAEAAAMPAEEICVCLSAFVQQEAFIPGILLNLIQEGVIPQFLLRLKELDA